MYNTSNGENKYKSQAKRTRSEVTDKSDYKCGFCAKILSTSLKLRNHVSQHTNENHFQCQECDMSYSSRLRLKIHINDVHTKGKRFPCQFPNCGKVFPSSNTLQNHLIRHDPESNLHTLVPCPICKAKYNKMSLKSHMNWQHRNDKMCTCLFILRKKFQM